MIDKIKDWFFYKEFRVRDNSHLNRNVGLNPEMNITILFDGTNEDDRKRVHRLKKSLNHEAQKNVKSLAYIDNALPLDNVDYAAYNKKNIKWYGVPFGQKVDEFLQLPSDILLILCKEMTPHFEFIVAHSSSSFIIGADINKAQKYFNLIIECENKNHIENIIISILKGIAKISTK